MNSVTSEQNLLLSGLPKAEQARLAPYLELVKMPLGTEIFSPNVPIRYVYFPTTAIVSLLNVMQDGASTEIAVVGKEGIVGISLFMGGGTTSNWAVVHSAGYGFRLSADRLQNEFSRSGPMQNVLLRYTQALLTQMAQTVICNRYHSIEQQLCRWLLMSLDRLPGNVLLMTQELIANMLGVRREGVTEAAGHLQKAGLISYKRGRIIIDDRQGLEERVCECYQAVRTETDRLAAVQNHPLTIHQPSLAARNLPRRHLRI